MGSWLASDPETLQSGAKFGAAGNASPARARALPPLLNHFVSVLSVQSVVKSFRREGGAEAITGCRHLIRVAIGNLSFGSPSSRFHSVSVSVALLLDVIGSVTPLGEVTVAVFEIELVAAALMVPVAL